MNIGNDKTEVMKAKEEEKPEPKEEKKPEPKEDKLQLEPEPNEADDKALLPENEERKKKHQHLGAPKPMLPSTAFTNVGIDAYPVAVKKEKRSKQKTKANPPQKENIGNKKMEPVEKSSENPKTGNKDGSVDKGEKKLVKKAKNTAKNAKSVEPATKVVPRSATGSDSDFEEDDHQVGCFKKIWANIRAAFGC